MLLQTFGLSKHFGGMKAVDKLDFQVHRGEIVGMIGPNGAGKTTVFNLIAGFLTPTEGRIVYKGELLNGLKPHSIAQKGITRTFQISSLFGGLTVLDNMLIGQHLKTREGIFGISFNTRGFRSVEREIRQKSLELLDFVGLGGKADLIAQTLPFGEQRNLEMAIALASDPELLLLDEPGTGMNLEESTRSMDSIQSIRKTGIAVLLIEHNMRMVMEICDRIVVLNYGAKIAEGNPEEVKKNSEVISAYLGEANESAES